MSIHMYIPDHTVLQSRILVQCTQHKVVTQAVIKDHLLGLLFILQLYCNAALYIHCTTLYSNDGKQEKDEENMEHDCVTYANNHSSFFPVSSIALCDCELFYDRFRMRMRPWLQMEREGAKVEEVFVRLAFPAKHMKT